MVYYLSSTTLDSSTCTHTTLTHTFSGAALQVHAAKILCTGGLYKMTLARADGAITNNNCNNCNNTRKASRGKHEHITYIELICPEHMSPGQIRSNWTGQK